MTRLDVELNAVVVAVTDEIPRVLTVSSMDPDAGVERPSLPSGNLDPEQDRTLDRALRRWLLEQTGITVGYVEQLYTFGDRFRHPAEWTGGPRMLSVAYLALTREEQTRGSAAWLDIYALLPSENRRSGDSELLDRKIERRVRTWVEGSEAEPTARYERARMTFGIEAPWDPVRVLERYELLYELGLVSESGNNRGLGQAMTLDHRRIVATALGRLRGKITYRPVVFELLPDAFTLSQLQRVVEALSGVPLHKQNFRRLVDRGGLVEGTGTFDHETGGRPAEIFRFRHEVLLERPRPGVGIPVPST